MARPTVSAAVYSAQRGGGIHKWVNEKTTSGSEQVLTDATLYHNLAAGEVVMIGCMCYNVETVSKDCSFEMASCDAVAGGGTPTALTGKVVIYTGGTKNEFSSQERKFTPPIRVAYADGVRSISMQVKGNDDATVISCGWQGYTELLM